MILLIIEAPKHLPEEEKIEVSDVLSFSRHILDNMFHNGFIYMNRHGRCVYLSKVQMRFNIISILILCPCRIYYTVSSYNLWAGETTS